MLLSHAVLLAEARSYLAALADRARTFDGAMEYERVLLQLDWLHGGTIAPLTAVPVSDPEVLHQVAATAIGGLASHGVDPLELELCLAMLGAARELDGS